MTMPPHESNVGLYRVVIVDRRTMQEVDSLAVVAECDIDAYDEIRRIYPDRERHQVIDRETGAEVDLG